MAPSGPYTWEYERSITHGNARKLRKTWCIVCGRSAVEEHSCRFHAAGGVLAGPYCSETCAFLWLKDDRVSDNEYPEVDIRESYRHDKELEHFSNTGRAEEWCNMSFWPSIEGHS